MKDISQVKACVIDHGLFLPIASKLAEQYDHVYYWSPWDDVAPKCQKGVIGDGLENVERVMDIWSIKDECDLFVFPDVGFGGLQKELISQGFPVWGHHGADELETHRGLFIETLENLGMDVAPYKKIVGLQALRDHLKDKTDKYIKVSVWRGNWETLKWHSLEEDRLLLDHYAYALGPMQDLFTFYVFDSIESDIEDGIDTYCINGKFPRVVMHGMERKDKSYLCAIQTMRSIPDKVREASEKFAPILESYGYRGFFSTEVRIAGEKSYFIDPTCRAASPPSQVMTELFGNLGEIIYAGAYGECVEPKATAKFGVQASITLDRECDEWANLKIKPELRQWVKLGFSCEVDGTLWEPPHDLKNMLGWLCATGDTVKEAIENLKDYRKELPDGLDCDVESIAHLIIEAEEAAEEGIEFPGELPSPAEVLI